MIQSSSASYLAWEVWKLASKVEGDMLKIVLFEVSVVTLMKMNEDGHDFARVHRDSTTTH